MVQGQSSATIYTTPMCPYCEMAKVFLKGHGVSFVEKERFTGNRAAAIEMMEKSGQMGVPVLDINGEIIVGFDRDAIKKALKLP